MSWAEQVVAIEERRAWLKVQGHPDPDRVVTDALIVARLAATDPVEAVRAAVAEA